MENAEEIRSPLATQNPNIMANHFGSKMQSKLRPPSAIKRPRDFSFTSGSTEEISKPKLRRSTSQLSLKEQSKSSKANTQQRSVSSALRRQTSAGALRGNTVVNSARQGLSASRVAPRPPKLASTGRNTGPISRTNTTKSKTLVSGSTASVTKVGGKKREKWDYKGRLEDMEVRYMETTKNMSQMTGVIDENRSRLELLERINQQLEGTVQVKNQQTEEASAKIQDLKTQIHVLEDEIKSLQMKHEFELEIQERAKKSLQKQNESLEMEYKIAKEEIASMKMTVAKMTADSLGITTELQATKVNLEKTVSDNRIKDETISRLEVTIRENKEAIADLEGKLRQEESVRRTLHNTIQELKGNIRVFCRIRPVLAEETSEPLTVFSFGNDDRMLSIEQSSPGESVTGIKKAATKYDFQFDKVFQPSATQEIVFEEISQLVQSALDGYNVCIFAYGQTGSGKTYTMEGNIRDDHKKGMISRALEQVFHSANRLLDKGWQYEMEASFLEIYNETLRDLLGSGDTNLKHEIKLVNGSNATGNANEVMVTNIKTVGVTSEDQVYSLLEKAGQNRAVAATHCNERSSRSHSVFRLKITGQNKLTDENCQGTLNLIDLAGSERLNNSCSTGERLKETKNINKSLSNLGNVIMALANKEQHIPYRNSKLTYLLQNSLGGNSKSLMFVNISPREESFQESLCSLRFATKVNQCNIGTAQKKVSHK